VKAALGHVYFDTAATALLYAPEVFSVVVQAVGSGQVLLGSDYPLVKAKRVMDQAKAALGSSDAEAVLHGNAQRLLLARR